MQNLSNDTQMQSTAERRLFELLKDGFCLLEAHQLAHPWFLMREGEAETKEQVTESQYNMLISSGKLELIKDSLLTGRIWKWKEAFKNLTAAFRLFIDRHPDQNKVYIVSKNGVSWTYRQLLEEVENRTEKGIEFLVEAVMLAIDLVDRNVEKLDGWKRPANKQQKKMRWQKIHHHHVLNFDGFEVARIDSWKDESIQKYLVYFPGLVVFKRQEFGKLEDAIDYAEEQLLKILHCMDRQVLSEAFLKILPAETKGEC